MTAFGEKIAASVVSEILRKLSSYPEKQILGIWNVEKKFQELEKSFGMLLATLRDAEKRQDNPELVGGWLERLKDVAYEADDVLGEFSFEVIRMGIDMRIESSKMEKVRGFFSNIHAVKFRSNMVDKIKKIYKKLDDIGKDMKRFKYILGGVNDDHSQNDQGPMITSPVIEDLHFLGRENEKSMLIDMLIGHSSSNEETLSVVSILGVGGLGKTTLARIVYNHDSVVAHFGNRMWVCVLHDFEIRKLREGMVQSLTGEKPHSSEIDEVIQKKLDDNLRGKNFLLVLDNVWNADLGGWEKLRASLKMGIQQGSKIIVTTRFTSVASIIRTLPKPLHLKGLTETESWSLFQKRAFAVGGARDNPNTETIGRELVEKCKGVPLAIQSLGALMHSKTTDLEWVSIQFSEIWKLEGQDNIKSVLKLSYHDMPPPLKRCFTYCSIFPKGHKIVKKTLIQQWMAEGLLQSSCDNKLMEDVGLEYFKSLVWVSFLQDVERDMFGEEVACKMHDLVHDLAQNIMGNECMIMKKVRAYLYLDGHNYCAKMFSNLRSVRVLDLQGVGIKSLPPSFGELKQLRYLDLRGNYFVTFPECVTNLYNLQTLKMLGMSSPEGILPKGITKMINLRHLEVDPRLRFPKGIGQLTNLQTLSCFNAANANHTKAIAASIEELGNLRQLGGILELRNLNGEIKDATAAKLKEKSRLRELRLRFWRVLSYPQPSPENGFDSDNELLENLEPHQNLISLGTFGFGGSKPPTWLDGSTGTSHLSFLQDLQLDNCPNIKSLSLVGLQSLRWLQISSCPNLSLGLGKGLTALEDITCRNLMSIGVVLHPKEEDVMPDLISLKTLKIHECNSLATLPDGFFSLLTSLETLEMQECSFAGRLPESIGNLSSLRVLYIRDCPDLVAFPESLGNLLALESLHMSECPGLVALPECLGNLSSLRFLRINIVPNLTELPESFRNLSSLRQLDIERCEGLAALPESFVNLSSLQELNISSCEGLVALPKSFGNQSSLQKLEISRCEGVAALPESFGNLITLQDLRVNDFVCFAALPESFGNLLQLQNLSIRNCASLVALSESFGDLLQLQNLSIRNCGSLVALPESFGNLFKLQVLSIEDCGSLVALPESFGNLFELKHLTIEGCGSLAALPKSLGKLSSLEKLFVKRCNALTVFSEILGDLSSLKELSIFSCTNLASLSERIWGLTSLEDLRISCCESMKSFPDGMHNLVSLHLLHIDCLKSLETLPDGLRNLSSLRYLLIKGCPRLMSLPDCFEGLTSLERLDLWYLKNLRALPRGLGKLSSLQYLCLLGCKNLKSLPKGIQNLRSLQRLRMIDCPQLEKRYRQRKFLGWPRIISHIPDIQMERLCGHS